MKDAEKLIFIVIFNSLNSFLQRDKIKNLIAINSPTNI